LDPSDKLVITYSNQAPSSVNSHPLGLTSPKTNQLLHSSSLAENCFLKEKSKLPDQIKPNQTNLDQTNPTKMLSFHNSDRSTTSFQNYFQPNSAIQDWSKRQRADVPPWQGKFIYQKFIKKLKVISYHKYETAVKRH
jgi:hypothetical protein